MTTHAYRTVDVRVDGGFLRTGLWEPTSKTRGSVAKPAPTLLAVHGITATHRSWDLLAHALPDVRIVAPDLRGRGRSNVLPGPYGIARHVDDLVAVLSSLDVPSVMVVGHSMGAFVAVVLADRYPHLVERLTLVDGGLPLEIPKGADVDELIHTVLGPAARRLKMTFPDHAAHRAFWAEHPAFNADLVDELAGYFDYDLQGLEGELRSSANFEAVTADQRALMAGEVVVPALERLDLPTTFIHAPRGLLDDAPLYRPEHVDAWAARVPSITMTWARDVNHYTVVMSHPGARLVAEQLAPAPEGVQG